ncbi:MAG: hypothetical protein ABL961_17045, partial [Vicinamibacterales bacterium]
ACSDSEIIEIAADPFRRFVLANPAAVNQVGAAVASRQAELEQRKAAAGPAVTIEAPENLIDRIRRFLSLD